MPGYSGTPLYKKLGILPSHKIIVDGFEGDYDKLLGVTINYLQSNKDDKVDLLHLFIRSTSDMEKKMKQYKKYIDANEKIIVWVSWYKKSSGITTDVTEDAIRYYALANGLVDVKVCAVDERWSGLKLVVPLKLRTGKVK